MNTILLDVQHKSNRRLLKEWLEARYTVTEADTLAGLDHPFDLCIVDAVSNAARMFTTSSETAELTFVTGQ
jgi:hypothetical protein